MTFEFPALSARIIISPTLREVPQNDPPQSGSSNDHNDPCSSRDVLAISSLGRWFETLILSFTTKEDDAI